MKIETERLVLRTPLPQDAPALLAIRNSGYVLRFNPMEPTTLERIQKQVAEDAASGKALYLEEKATGQCIGGIWLGEDSLRFGVEALDFSYFLSQQSAGKGLMTEALGAALTYAFQTLGAQIVSARVFVGNQGSARVLEKLGFSQEGTLRRAVKDPRGQIHDDMLFSLLREEWENREA